LSDYPDPTSLTEDFSLKELVPDYYILEIELLDGSDQILLYRKENFYITPLESLAGPGSYPFLILHLTVLKSLISLASSSLTVKT